MFNKKGQAPKRQLLDGIHLETLAHGAKTLMGQFSLAKGAKIPEHAHPHEQTGYLLEGRLRFVVAGEVIDAEPGDSWCIPGDVPHSAEALSDALVLEIFSPVREDYLP